jgi:hypothetical protein
LVFVLNYLSIKLAIKSDLPISSRQFPVPKHVCILGRNCRGTPKNAVQFIFLYISDYEQHKIDICQFVCCFLSTDSAPALWKKAIARPVFAGYMIQAIAPAEVRSAKEDVKG